MPEKYQPPQEERDGQNEHFVVPIQEPAKQPSVPQQETNESPFDQKKYDLFDLFIKNIHELGMSISSLANGADPKSVDDPEIFIDAILQDFHIAEEALTYPDTRKLAMNFLRQLIEQAQDSPDFFHKLQKTYILARDTLGRHLDTIDTSIRENPEYAYQAVALRTLITMRNYGLGDDREKAVRMLRSHVDKINAIKNKEFDLYADLLELVFSYGTEQDKDRWHEKINTFFEGNKYRKFSGRLAIENLFRSHDALARMHGNALTVHELEKYGIQGKAAQDTIHAWQTSEEKTYVPHAIASNIGVISELEEKQPGCVERLWQEFGIRDFARYPMEMLLTQDANRDKKDGPYGIIMYARSDHNGVMYQISGTLEQLHRSLHGGYQIRVMEYEGKPQFGRKLLELRKRYGSEHKISFALITEHGSQYQIGKLLAASELEKQRVRRATDFFEKDATLILVSCSTGKPYGIGHGISDILGMHVIAPDEPTSVNALHAEVKEGKLKFSIEYSRAHAQEYIEGERQPTEVQE